MMVERADLRALRERVGVNTFHHGTTDEEQCGC